MANIKAGKINRNRKLKKNHSRELKCMLWFLQS